MAGPGPGDGDGPLEQVLREWAHEAAPRKGAGPIGPDSDLGFGGYGMTVMEYLGLLARVAESYDTAFPGEQGWPHTLREIARQVRGRR